MTKPLAFLEHVEVLGKLSTSERKELASLSSRRILGKGEILCHQGDQWPFIIYIDSGALRSVINSLDGRELSVSTWEAGEVFWSHTIFDCDPMPATLEAIRKSVIYQWHGDDVLALCMRNDQAIKALLRRQTRLIRKRREVIYNLAFHPVASRLAKYLLERFSSDDADSVTRDLTLEEMASMMASSPEVICRILYQFQSDGILKITRANITLQNRAALNHLAENN
jgi:CRP/FNR family transcriptional regulator